MEGVSKWRIKFVLNKHDKETLKMTNIYENNYSVTKIQCMIDCMYHLSRNEEVKLFTLYSFRKVRSLRSATRAFLYLITMTNDEVEWPDTVKEILIIKLPKSSPFC